MDSHEPDNGGNFDDGEYELGFAVAFYTRQVDKNNDEEENSHKNGWVQRWIPIPNGQRASDDLQGKDHDPLQGITVASR